MERLGIIGVGRLASFVVEGLRRAGDRRAIVLSPRGGSAELARTHDCELAVDNQQVVDRSDLILLSPSHGSAIESLEELRCPAGRLVIYVGIDATLERLRRVAPDTELVRAMPSSSAALNLCVTPIYPDHDRVRRLFSALGPVEAVPSEIAFDAATALAGFYLWEFALMAEMVHGAEEAGLPREAAISIVAGHVRAAAMLVLQADPAASVRAELDRHGTAGTMTADGLAVIEQGGCLTAWREAYHSCLNRLRRSRNEKN